MKFVILYKNDKTVREQALNILTQAIKQGHDFSKGTLVVPNLLQTFLGWPTLEDTFQFPLDWQCEQLEYVEEKFNSLRVLVIDVEATVTVEKTIAVVKDETRLNVVG